MKPGQRKPETPAVPITLLRLVERWQWLILIVLVLVALALRAADLRADPPPDLSWSLGPFTDETYNTYSARNMLLYGAWKVDDFFPFVVYPLVNLLTLLVFRLFGMGFVQVKLISLLAGVCAVPVIYHLVRRDFGPLAGLLSALGLAVSFPLVMYGRLGLVESVQILFLLLAGLFYVRGLERPWQMFWCGLCAVSTVLLVKASAGFVLPALLMVFLWELLASRTDESRRCILVRGILPWFLGAAVAVAIWLGLVFLPHRSEYVRYVLRHSFESPAGHPQDAVAYLFNTLTIGAKSRLAPRVAWTALLGMLVLPGLVHKPSVRFLGLWFVTSFLMLGYMNYRPDRYELVLIPVLVAGFAVGLSRLLEKGTLLPATQPNPAKAALYSVWLMIPVGQLVIHAGGLENTLRAQSSGGLLVKTIASAAIVGLAGYGITRLVRDGITLRPVTLRAVLALLLLALSLRLDLTQYFAWFGNRTHDMVAYAHDIDRALPDNAVLAGSWAPALLVNSRKRAVCITDWANTDDPVNRFGVTHMVSPENGLDINLFSRQYPDLMARATVLRRYFPRGLPLTVYELPRPASGSGPD